MDKFEHFVFNYDNWVVEMGLNRKKAVLNVGQFLEGKAMRWYMTHVANTLRHTRWDMTRIYQETMRKKYQSKNQGEPSVQDYFAELSLMHRRLKEVSNAQHVQRAWDGAARYIRAEWAIKGILPENTTIEELRETALDIERAHKIRKSIENKNDYKRGHKRNRSKSPNRHDNQRSDNYKKKDNNREDYRNNRNNKKHGQRRSDSWHKSKTPNPKSAKSDKQRNEYRAANKCFERGETGHMVKDCPTKNRAKPSSLRLNAAMLKPEEKIRASLAFLKVLEELSKTKDRIKVSALLVNSGRISKKTKGDERKIIEQNTTRVKDLARRVPNTLVVRAELAGESIHALLDSGSQADLVSATLVDQLK
ncbi:hypothetical protein FRC07_000510 [Ceratobasidium sp. 392]|nr:hypothetical protein FRC07_000510 [Ceratobasidium sp. 392]